MAKLPQKIAANERASETTLREFVSTAAHKPQSGAVVTRVNLSLTNDDLERSEGLQQKLTLSRVEIFRAGLVALDHISNEEQLKIAEEIRSNSPKAGRPPVRK